LEVFIAPLELEDKLTMLKAKRWWWTGTALVDERKFFDVFSLGQAGLEMMAVTCLLTP